MNLIMKNNKLNNFNILDCTLRDGGYYNKWDFDNNLIKSYFSNIKKSNIKHVEIGFRFFSQNYFLGSLAYSTDHYLKTLKIPKNIMIYVMINSSDLINKKVSCINELLDLKRNSRVNGVRLATHFKEVKSLLPFIKKINSLGYKIIVNLMQANDRSEDEIYNTIKLLKKSNCVSILYFADSLGKMEPKDISRLYCIAKKFWKKDFGIHTHDNKGFALQNSLEAIKNGVNWIDSTIQGMGRGAGNLQTEILLAEVDKEKHIKYKLEPIYKLSEGPFLNLKRKYNWGKSLNYFLAAKNNIHPTYIQTLENDKRYSNKKIYEIIRYLKNIDAKSYNKKTLEEYLNKDIANFKGNWNAAGWCNNKNVLLIGPGTTTETYKDEIENLLKIKKFIGISINLNQVISKNLISYYIASNENRIMVDIYKYAKINKPLIIPYSRVKNLVKKFKPKLLKDYGLKIDKNKLKIKSNFCFLPNSLVFGYAVANCIIGKAKKIYLVGFDGNDVDGSAHEEMLETIKLFKDKYKNLKLTSLTPTNYPIVKSSIYAKNI